MTETQLPPVDERGSVLAPLRSPQTDAPASAPDAPDESRPPPRWPRQEEQSAGRTVHIQIPKLPWARLVGLALMGIGGLIVLFLVYLFAFTPITANRNQQRLAHTLSEQKLQLFSLVEGHLPAEGKPVAVLDIPRIGVHQVVVVGTSAADLMNGPGLLTGSALPGTPGNAVIAGRRVTFGAPFGALTQLHKGAVIHVVDGAGAFTYRVSRTVTVGNGQTDVVTPTLKNRITLVTADSTLVTSGRLAVEGTLVGHAVAVPNQVVAIPSYDLGLTGDPVAGGLAVFWTFLSLMVLVGAGILVWRWKRPGLVYLFAMPVFLACGLFACQAVARALPATF
jgi:sortase A